MALIHCPECGLIVSDEADVCIHCGYPLKKKREESQEEIPAESENTAQDIQSVNLDSISPIQTPIQDNLTSAPTEASEDNAEVKDTTAPSISCEVKKSKKKPLIILAIIGAVTILLVILITNVTKTIEQNKVRNEYIKQVNNANIIMSISGAKAEGICDKVSDIWENAINKTKDSGTDKYTRPSGYFVDFNEAILNYYASMKTEDLVTLSSNENVVKDIMKKIQNPTSEFKDAYDTLNDLYEIYVQLADLAQKPEGNYNTYSAKVNNLTSEFVTKEKKLQTQMPDVETSGTVSIDISNSSTAS
jgi:flagellar basal body-associated protein FliL